MRSLPVSLLSTPPSPHKRKYKKPTAMIPCLNDPLPYKVTVQGSQGDGHFILAPLFPKLTYSGFCLCIWEPSSKTTVGNQGHHADTTFPQRAGDTEVARMLTLLLLAEWTCRGSWVSLSLWDSLTKYRSESKQRQPMPMPCKLQSCARLIVTH